MICVYDIECLIDMFLLIAKDVATGKVKTFEISNRKDKREELYKFLSSLSRHKQEMVGFNNLKYDMQLVHQIMLNKNFNQSNQDIYNFSQEVIHQDKNIYQPWVFQIPQLDLYKISHFDNKNKRTSLKQLQYTMNYKTVQDMPYSHDQRTTDDQKDEIVQYCLNDIESTEAYYKTGYMQSAIELRRKLTKEFGINCMNFNDTQIGSEIFLLKYSAKTKIPIKEIRNQRTPRPSLALKEVILPYIKFNSVEFNSILKQFNANVIDTTVDKLKLEKSVVFNNIQLDFALGGLHGSIKPGIYESDDEYDIIDIDVSSYYPNLAIQNQLYPEHLGIIYCEILNDFYQERKLIPKTDPKNGAYKLALNGTYGKSKEKFSFFYDPKYTMATTINGQLLLAMLLETTDFCQVLQVNTDGITFKVHRNDKDKFLEACNDQMKMTKLELEFNYYKKMIIRDVNNYIAVSTNNKIKQKGIFEIDLAYHKKSSFRIIPLALTSHFVFGRSYVQYIQDDKNILNFVGGVKKKEDFDLIYTVLKNGSFVNTKLQKVTRYYASKSNSVLMKHYKDGRKIQVHAKTNIKVLQELPEEFPSDVNKQYYIRETRKIIDLIENKQYEQFTGS